MSRVRGIITLMGSGELTASMVELHKTLLARLGPRARACFMDTPAGFQLNREQLAAKAVTYFGRQVNHELGVASLPSADADDGAAAERCYAALRAADYILVGPGSPTYALEEWRRTRVPQILVQRIEQGACLVAASAAALTMGRLTLPVYEIYKVGRPPHWVPGLDLLAAFGLDWVVVPHWNNAEGGNHDTRYCFMGAPRLAILEAQLPAGTTLVGVDEHTALVLDLAVERLYIRGLGRVCLRRQGVTRILDTGVSVTLDELRDGWQGSPPPAAAPAEPPSAETAPPEGRVDRVWAPVERLAEQAQAQAGLGAPLAAVQRLLALEEHIHRQSEALEERNGLGAAREVLRRTLLDVARHLSAAAGVLPPLVTGLLTLRDRLRAEHAWAAADAVRDCLQHAGVVVEDTPQGVRWRLNPTEPEEIHP